MVRDIDFHLKYCFSQGNLKLATSGRSKRNIPLPIFKNEPISSGDEYIYLSANKLTSNLDDYGKKGSVTLGINSVRCMPLLRGSRLKR